MSTMYAASFEAMYSAFSRMQVQKTWEGILNAPVGLDDIVFAEMLWAALKSLFSAIAIARCWWCWASAGADAPGWRCRVLFLVGVTFSSIALVFNALAKGYDFFTYYFTLVLTPMTFLSGVYFPTEHMPGWLQAVAGCCRCRPRWNSCGRWSSDSGRPHWLRPLAVLLAYAAGRLLALALAP